MQDKPLEQIQILYEMAIAIGDSLDLHKMLKKTLSTFLKKLNCSAGGVFFAIRLEDENWTFKEIYSIPRHAEKNDTYRAALQSLPVQPTADEFIHFQQQLPLSEHTQAGNYSYVLELPDLGLLALVKNGQALDPFVIKSLKPLLLKLSRACQACLKNQELADVHDNTIAINLELTQKSLELDKSQRDLLDTLLELRQTASRNQAILGAIPDKMFFLNRSGQILGYKMIEFQDTSDGAIVTNEAGENLHQMMPSGVANLIVQRINQTLDSFKMQIFEYIIPDEQGKQYFEARLVVNGPDEVLAIVRDITERKQTEAEIKNLARFPSENPGPVLRVRKDGVILYANDAGSPLLDDWQCGVGQLLPDHLIERVQEVFKAGIGQDIEIGYKGQIYTFLLVPVAETDYINLYGRDITDRRLAEKALQTSEARTRAIINTAPDGIITIDEQGVIESFNPAAERIFAYAADEVIGQNVSILMPPPYREEHNGYLANYLETGSKKVIGIGREIIAQRKDGTTFPMYLAVGEVHLGNRKMFTGIIQDITERKRAEQTLGTVLDTVGEGIITIDASGTVVMVNQEVQNIWRYRQEELIGGKLGILMPEEYRQAHTLGIERYLKTGEAHVLGKRMELEGLRKNGQKFPLEIRITEANIGEQQLFIAAVRDITERHELDKMRDDFVSTISHELRTPLASSMGFVETILSGRPGPLTDIQQKFLEKSYKSSERLLKLIEELLTVSRVQQGRLKLNKQSFSISYAIQNMRDVVISLADNKSIALEIKNGWPEGKPFTGDQDRLEQVMINLVGNAIKFTPNEGQVQIHSQQKDGNWYFEVTDTGIGIPQADIPHLFDRFYRAGNVMEAQIQGTGLGLYVCKAIIEEHHGQIGIEGEPNVGTTVWFMVPEAR